MEPKHNEKISKYYNIFSAKLLEARPDKCIQNEANMKLYIIMWKIAYAVELTEISAYKNAGSSKYFYIINNTYQ